jgi:hypothetical protein
MTSPQAVKVWDHDNGDEPDEPNADRYASRTVGWLGPPAPILNPETVARNYAERRYADDYPEQQTIHVRDTDGNLHRYLVSAVPSVDFLTKEIT